MMIVDLITYLIVGILGFVLGLLVGSLWKEVHQIKEVVVDQNETTQSEPDGPKHKKSWRILGGFVMLIALGQLGYTVWWTDQEHEKTECLADYVSDSSVIQGFRSGLATEDRKVEFSNRRQLFALLQNLGGPENNPEDLQRALDYRQFLKDSIEASKDREVVRKMNPVPSLQDRDCGVDVGDPIDINKPTRGDDQ